MSNTEDHVADAWTRMSNAAMHSITQITGTATIPAGSNTIGQVGGYAPSQPKPDKRLIRGEKATDFVVWLSGALDILDEEPPTKEQWAKVREKAVEIVADHMRSRLVEEEKSYTDEYAARVAAWQAEILKQKAIAEQYAKQVEAQQAQIYRMTSTAGTLAAPPHQHGTMVSGRDREDQDGPVAAGEDPEETGGLTFSQEWA